MSRHEFTIDRWLLRGSGLTIGMDLDMIRADREDCGPPADHFTDVPFWEGTAMPLDPIPAPCLSQSERRDIPGYPGFQADSDGCIWSCWSYGGVLGSRWRKIKLQRYHNGVRVLLLMGGSLFMRQPHHLILLAFAGPCPKDAEAVFLDGDRTNLRVSNLRWVPLAETRLWSRLVEMPSGCREWQGAKDAKGYGNIRFMGRWFKAHQLAYEFSIGPRPAGLFVLHHCDNPSCCNPDHLFLGTNYDNVRDMDSKGRRRTGIAIPERRCRGERRPGAKLTDASVAAIRKRYAAGGITMDELGRIYGVDKTSIFYIVHRVTWAHVP